MEVLLLCGDTYRAKSYLQVLPRIDGINLSAIVYGTKQGATKRDVSIELDKDTLTYMNTLGVDTPSLGISIEELLNQFDIEHTFVHDRDVNSEKIISQLRQSSAPWVIFAGYGGQILSSNHFTTTKKYIHCHPGWLPKERGSTTLYYSILKGANLSVTAFFMTAEIDKGEMIIRQSYPLPTNIVDIDRYVDNYLRADTLKKAMILIQTTKSFFKPTAQEYDEEYFIIHPLLKHIALLSLSDSYSKQ